MNQSDVTVTVVQSDPRFPLGAFAETFGDHAVVVRLHDGDEVPSLADLGDALVVLGGTPSVHDVVGHPWLSPLRTLVADAVAAGVPVLGTGLGAQLLAVARGGHVEVSPPPGQEDGTTQVYWRRGACDDPVLAHVVAVEDRTVPVATHHRDAVVDLPADGVWLGSSALYPFQAFRSGSGLGLQFQPEATRELVQGWTQGLEEQAAAAALAAFDEHAERVLGDGRRIAEAFLAQAAVRRARAAGGERVPA
ncbi:type 1 glutamine amidotransferase [Cellulomonas sp. PhB143]|uniref:type 1 glutamine amidotransferase n=1 Tax=Cellulomonas sp. PhB143 TaxID=2485186 RepID=UPI000F9C9F05|nr:type 1 glutamine amidotransferase [Cellulomonas sp. PhB143]ROS78757.1 GMP synthase (glutamine-hydrolysing) [Cellulomonas sp. PhB143]